ncbi:MAG: winged helix-turn-helix domain-containing protein [Planctomycetaceae bacterium]
MLLRADGWTWQQIQTALFCSTDLVAETVRCFASGGGWRRCSAGDEAFAGARRLATVKRWLTEHTPQDFGYFRSRWSCEILANLLAWETGLRLSGETIRRGLKRLGFVWRRPRPVVGPIRNSPRNSGGFQRLLSRLPADEVAVFQDEVDVHLNPKIGSMWMPKGEQALVTTPGNNRKCHVARSLVWGTGTLLVSPPEGRNTAMFLAIWTTCAAVCGAGRRSM